MISPFRRQTVRTGVGAMTMDGTEGDVTARADQEDRIVSSLD